jgi:AraC-like DNA-binding protein
MSRREYRAFFRTSAVPGTEVLVARRSPLPSHLYQERYAICVCLRSAKRLHSPTSDLPLFPDPDSVWLLQPGDVRIDDSARGCMDFNMLFIEPALVIKAASGRGLTQALRFSTSRSRHDPLFKAGWEFCKAVQERAEGGEQQERFAACLRYVLDFMDGTPSAPPRVKGVHSAVTRARDLLQQRFSETVTLDELADVSGLSRFHLVRCFATHVGLTPHAYQLRLRIERAMALLRQGVRPGEVANLVGFADQSHLTRHFRRILRVTPGRYAQAGDAP